MFDHFSNFGHLANEKQDWYWNSTRIENKSITFFRFARDFQIDNDLEIENELIDWPGNTCIVNGRFDQENESLKNMISSIRSLNWPVELNKIIFKLNASLNPIKLRRLMKCFLIVSLILRKKQYRVMILMMKILIWWWQRNG